MRSRWALNADLYSADSRAVALDPGSTTIIPATEVVQGRCTIEES